jgi:hypothetical protein
MNNQEDKEVLRLLVWLQVNLGPFELRTDGRLWKAAGVRREVFSVPDWYPSAREALIEAKRAVEAAKEKQNGIKS